MKLTNKMFSVITILLHLRLTAGQIIGRNCRRSAPCVGLRDCKPIMGLLGKLEKPLRPSVVEFLHAQQCGFTNGIPKVCCGSLPKNLKIFKNAPDNDARRFVIKTTTTQKPTTSATSTKNMSEEKRRRMEEALNREFSSDFFDAGFDLFMFRRKKRDKNEQLEVEIR